MKINEEQFEAHQAEADKQRTSYKKKLAKKQLHVFELAEKLQAEASAANIPFLLFISADKRETNVYRFHNFFSVKYHKKFMPKPMIHAGKWARVFAGSCYRFLKEVCMLRIILKNEKGETVADSAEE